VDLDHPQARFRNLKIQKFKSDGIYFCCKNDLQTIVCNKAFSTVEKVTKIDANSAGPNWGDGPPRDAHTKHFPRLFPRQTLQNDTSPAVLAEGGETEKAVLSLQDNQMVDRVWNSQIVKGWEEERV
jgi:hypothetical protein